ncbi:hypothetical protein L6452_04117 [Arctium lappa]|uniref:Uncharacterized protein n=1 Tax=Arctium lappa TaxID=4217 RepID=A0ACB9FP25_ARCLA|nr:hypothetical protein L6452_04117 [Arctium lappa]
MQSNSMEINLDHDPTILTGRVAELAISIRDHQHHFAMPIKPNPHELFHVPDLSLLRIKTNLGTGFLSGE